MQPVPIGSKKERIDAEIDDIKFKLYEIRKGMANGDVKQLNQRVKDLQRKKKAIK